MLIVSNVADYTTTNIAGQYVHIIVWKQVRLRRDITVVTGDIVLGMICSTAPSSRQKKVKRKMKFLSFPSIESFHNVVKAVNAYPHIASGTVSYRGKVKLHGTNAGVRVSHGNVHAQSRTQLIEVGNDNAGFAAWVDARKDYFRVIGGIGVTLREITIFGEFCGPGIMKGTAINGIPNKIFAIFAIMLGDDTESAVMVTEPAEIEQMLGTDQPDSYIPGFIRPCDVYVLPWQGDAFQVHYSDKDSLQSVVDQLNKVVETIEPSDPWVKATFGAEGICEGVVYVPGAGKRVTRKQYSDLAFKAKGEKHKVNKTKQAVQIDPEVAKSIDEFVTMFATEARFEQGLAALNITLEMRNIGPFLKWTGQDVLKESADELEASGLEWSDVEKSLQTQARNWYITKSKAIA